MIYTNEILGGLLIGLASALPLLVEGKIAGVSGFAESCLRPKTSSGLKGLLFVIGLIIGGFFWKQAGGTMPEPQSSDIVLWVIAGLLVGFGSRLAGGCTSGHGVCGMGRISKRSILSVMIFMSFAILTNLILEIMK